MTFEQLFTSKNQKFHKSGIFTVFDREQRVIDHVGNYIPQ